MTIQNKNKELEAELKQLLTRINDSKKLSKREVMDLCGRYIALCMAKGDLSETSIEISNRLLDILEVSLKND